MKRKHGYFQNLEINTDKKGKSMKKKVLLIIFSFILSILNLSCVSPTLTLSTDYDETTFEKKDFSNDEILGEVKISYLLASWKKFALTDEKTNKVLTQLENKAIRKYGRNINLIDTEISNYDKSKSTALYVALPITGLGAMVTGMVTSENELLPNSAAYPIAILGYASLMTTPFLKIGTAKATVIKSNTPYQSAVNKLTTKAAMDYNARTYKNNEIQKQQKKLEAQKQQELYEQNLLEEKRIDELEIRKTEIENRLNILNKDLENEKQSELDKKVKEFYGKIPILFTPSKNFSSYTSLLLGGKTYGNTDTDSYSGRVDITIDFINISPKTIKYVYFDVSPYNKVGDKIPNKDKTLEIVEFIYPYQANSFKWNSVWYDKTCLFFKIDKI